MKKFTFLLFLLPLIVLSSCNKEEEEDPKQEQEETQCEAGAQCVTATIDGEEFVANLITGAEILGTTTISAYMGVSVTESISMIIEGHDVGKQEVIADLVVFSYRDTNTSLHTGTDGFVEITSYDESSNTIEGVFEITVENAQDNSIVKEITDGFFRVAL